MLEEIKWFDMADELETATCELEKAKALLSIALECVFADAEESKYLSGYVQNFEFVIEAAFDKIIEQHDCVKEISMQLYEINREVKGV